MKFADRLLYTVWIMWLVMFFVWLPTASNHLIEAISTIGGIWIFCFAAGGLVGSLMFEHVGKHKHQELERFRFNKRFIAKLLNVWCLFIWNPPAKLFHLTDWQAMIFIVIAGVFSGYTYIQDIRRFLFNLIDLIFPNKDEARPDSIGLFDRGDVKVSKSDLSERDALDLLMLEKARATLTIPARLVDGD